MCHVPHKQSEFEIENGVLLVPRASYPHLALALRTRFPFTCPASPYLCPVENHLPIHEIIPDLRKQLTQDTVVLLQAPPGAGKSTVLPLQLLDEPWLQGQKVIMLQPRRLAAKSVAARMAKLLGEEVGQTVGYRVRFESKTSRNTRIEVVTEGILTRFIQEDPSLEGIAMVIFDEFHERSLQADLAWVLARQVQEVMRPDLRMLVMSATLDTGSLSAALGNVPLLQSEGRQFPVQIHYEAQPKDWAIAAQVFRVIRKALQQHVGDILVFLPGQAEIHQVEGLLAEAELQAEVHPLYGNLPLEQQQAAILPNSYGRRKIVLSTTIAETSLTIEGISVVIDSGLSRQPRFDPRSGMTRLETVQITRDAADQRAGRAGRLGPGICYRLWEEATHHYLIAHRQPEILSADLAPTVLELAQWGEGDLQALPWPTPPPAGAVEQARSLLRMLAALDQNQITDRGKAMLRLPTHPRLAHLLVEGAAMGHGALAADIAAILEERDPMPRTAGTDLRLRVDALQHWRDRQPVNADRNVLQRVDRLARQWQANLPKKHLGKPDSHHVGRLLALAYPERVAKQLSPHQPAFRLSIGRRAALPQGDTLIAESWLAIANLDAGTQEGKIFLAAPVDPTELTELHNAQEILEWDARQGVLNAATEQRVGSLAFDRKPTKHLPVESLLPVLLSAVGENPLLLDWDEAVEQMQGRVQSLRIWRPNEDWPDFSQAALLANLDAWLAPYIAGVRRAEDFKKLNLTQILHNSLDWQQGQQLMEWAPTHLEAPTGSQIKLAYALDGSPPIMAVRLQEMFGCLDTPTVNQGRQRVMLHLLSPAFRPVQVTQDLRSFWTNTYADVRKDLRGRYPKHHWPEDPFTAEPVRGPKRKPST